MSIIKYNRRKKYPFSDSTVLSKKEINEIATGYCKGCNAMEGMNENVLELIYETNIKLKNITALQSYCLEHTIKNITSEYL
jgi:hypothetical protein